MTSYSFSRAVGEFAGFMSSHQRRLMAAQFDAAKAWLAPGKSPCPTPRGTFDHHIDGSLAAGALLLEAQVQTQNELLRWSERWLSLLGKEIDLHMTQLPTTPAASAMHSAMTVGGCAMESMSKASRQVNQFACASLNAAARRAVSSAREELDKPAALPRIAC